MPSSSNGLSHAAIGGIVGGILGALIIGCLAGLLLFGRRSVTKGESEGIEGTPGGRLSTDDLRGPTAIISLRDANIEDTPGARVGAA